MNGNWMRKGLKLSAALAMAAALAGCVVAPYGYGPPRYGYYHPHPYGYY